MVVVVVGFVVVVAVFVVGLVVVDVVITVGQRNLIFKVWSKSGQ